MTDEEIAWVAGLLEGEGWFGFNDKECRYPKIRMESIDFDTVYRLQELVGGRTYFHKRHKPHHNDTLQFQMTRHKDVRELCRLIHPWMSERRQAKIDILLASPERNRTPATGTTD